MTKKRLKEMKALIEGLSKYCHVKGCRYWNLCPRKHKKCEKKLGLDTAIAWVSRMLIISNDSLKEKRSKILTLFYTCYLHPTKYVELMMLLKNAINFLEICIDEEEKEEEEEEEGEE